jgi:hypothetical protein
MRFRLHMTKQFKARTLHPGMVQQNIIQKIKKIKPANAIRSGSLSILSSIHMNLSFHVVLLSFGAMIMNA